MTIWEILHDFRLFFIGKGLLPDPGEGEKTFCLSTLWLSPPIWKWVECPVYCFNSFIRQSFLNDDKEIVLVGVLFCNNWLIVIS